DCKKAAAIDLAGTRADLHLRIDMQSKTARKFLPWRRLPGSDPGDAEAVGVRESHTPLLQRTLGEVRRQIRSPLPCHALNAYRRVFLHHLVIQQVFRLDPSGCAQGI